MSNISRRDFLKTAGVMTLAVAAAGVLAGCEGNTAPAPEANKPEVTTNSVSYTSYTGDKLTVESLGRFNLYASHDAKEPDWCQTVLKVTWTKPEYSTETMVGANAIGVMSQSAKPMYNAANINQVDGRLKKKFNLSDANMIYDLSDTDMEFGNALKVEKYIVMKTKEFATNDLKIIISFVDEKGEVKSLIMPLSVAATDVY